MIKTGSQFFKTNIFDKINNEVQISEIILESDPRYTIRLCDVKWLRVPGTLTVSDDEAWLVTKVDYNTMVVDLERPTPEAELKVGQRVRIDSPIFKSGTQLNLNAEEAHKRDNGIILEPLFIWLVETVKGRELLQTENGGAQFEFVFCILFTLNKDIADTYNNERHIDGVIQATQLRSEIKRILDNTNGITRESAIEFIEYNLFGRETKQGIEKYILDANLSGIECRVTVKATRKMCNCEC